MVMPRQPRLFLRLNRNLARLRADLGLPTPAAATAVDLRWAEAARRGAIFFYDRQEVAIGFRDVDWTGRHVAHQEWPAQLNRFFCLPRLVAAWRATGDAELPRIARGWIEDWIAQHDYSAAHPPAPGDNTLNLGIRLAQSTGWGWWMSVPLFAGSDAFDDAFLRRMVASTRGQLACLKAHLTHGGNWRISHLDAMLCCGLLLPDELDEWLPFAVRSLNETFHRQIHADGAHEEHNPSYHSWMCEVFTRFWRLARARPRLGLRLDTPRVARMWNYAVCSNAPGGGSSGLHDAPCWGVHADPDDPVARLDQREAVLREARLRGPEWDLRRRPTRFFPQAGQLFLRTGWRRRDEWLLFDATRWCGGHCHLSRLALGLYAHGRMLLHDPGYFTYEMSDPFGAYGKSTPAHNTVTVEGLSQSEANPELRALHTWPDAALVCASYGGGYWPGTYTWHWAEGKGAGVFGVHTRAVLWLRGRGLLVWDWLDFQELGRHWAAHWQLPAGPHRLDARARTVASAGAGLGNVALRVLAASDPVACRVYEGQRNPLRGWLPGDLPGQYRPAPQAAFELSSSGRAGWLVTLIQPFTGDGAPTVAAAELPNAQHPGHGWRLRWPDGAEDLVALTPGLATQVETAGPLATDGCAAVVRLRDGRAVSSLLIGGMVLDHAGRPLQARKSAGAWRAVHRG